MRSTIVCWQESPSILIGAKISISRWTRSHQNGADDVRGSEVRWAFGLEEDLMMALIMSNMRLLKPFLEPFFR